jgi:hypothetical protein
LTITLGYTGSAFTRQAQPRCIPSYFTLTTLVDLNYRIVNYIFIYLIGASDLCSVMETAIVFLYLFALLFCCAASYGYYLLAAMFVSSDSPAKGRKGIVEYFLMTTVMGSTFSMLSLCGALLFFLLMFHLGRRYLASPLGQFIVGLPGVRLIPYVHRKYWLPSAVSFRPRPRFFYLKRLIIRQSNLFHHSFSISISSTIFLYRC